MLKSLILKERQELKFLVLMQKLSLETYITQNPEMEKKLSAGFIEKVLGVKSDKFVQGVLHFLVQDI